MGLKQTTCSILNFLLCFAWNCFFAFADHILQAEATQKYIQEELFPQKLCSSYSLNEAVGNNNHQSRFFQIYFKVKRLTIGNNEFEKMAQIALVSKRSVELLPYHLPQFVLFPVSPIHVASYFLDGSSRQLADVGTMYRSVRRVYTTQFLLYFCVGIIHSITV